MERSVLESLIGQAAEARQNAYCPYSHFAVGAALLAKDGSVYRGVNCENASYGGTICAERSAMLAAVTAGKREFVALAICAGDAPTYPCGLCRQALAEFGDLTVICANADGSRYETCRLSELLPHTFDRSAIVRDS